MAKRRGAASGVRLACGVDHREQVRCADAGRAQGPWWLIEVTTASLVERVALTVAGGVTVRSTSMIVPTVTVRGLAQVASLSVRISRSHVQKLTAGRMAVRSVCSTTIRCLRKRAQCRPIARAATRQSSPRGGSPHPTWQRWSPRPALAWSCRFDAASQRGVPSWLPADERRRVPAGTTPTAARCGCWSGEHIDPIVRGDVAPRGS